MITIDFYGKLTQEETEIQARKMEFCRRMVNKETKKKEGSPYGDIRYGAFDNFSPSGGGEK